MGVSIALSPLKCNPTIKRKNVILFVLSNDLGHIRRKIAFEIRDKVFL
jgi:hypothetical protein